ncbi:MAG: delta-60 repeat domain-containing protein, partial [Verrucomicrobiota bacterium]
MAERVFMQRSNSRFIALLATFIAALAFLSAVSVKAAHLVWDTQFSPVLSAVNGYVYDAVKQSDGKVVMVGDFMEVKGVARVRVAR